MTISVPEVVEIGWGGSVTVSGISSISDDYINLRIDGPGTYDDFFEWQYLPGNGSFSEIFYPPPFEEEGAYEVTATFDYSGATASRTVYAGEPEAPEFTRASLTRTEFYPRVRDRFQDDVKVYYATRRPARVGIKVLNRQGRVVRSVRPTNFSPGWPGSWTWNGKTNSGALAGVGRYRVKLTATSTGLSASKVLPVQIRSDVVTKRGYDYWNGLQTFARKRAGDCYMQGYSYDGSLSMNCFDYNGGSTARAEWWFRLPNTARNIRWGINGNVQCCSPGAVNRDGKRVRPKKFVVSLGISGLRSFNVNYAWVRFTYKQRR